MFINTINNFNLNKNNTSQSFKSRNPEIRFADDIARKVNQEFPRLSFTQVLEFSNIDRFQLFAYFLNQKIVAMRSVKSNLYNNAISLSEKLLALTSSIKKFQVGNCGESAQLAEIAARTNSIKDCYCTLLSSQDEIIDHEVLLVYNNGKSYVIDPWLGFADYLPKATERYRSEFRKYFDENIESYVEYNGIVSHDPTGDIFSGRYSEDDLKRLYPELVLKKDKK